MAKARKIPGLQADARFGDVAAAAVEVRAGEVFGRLAGVLEIDDIERVHDARVATRRLRAALEVFAACLPKKEHKRVLREVKELADALGKRRDPDVAIESLERIATALGDEARAGIEGLAHELRAEQRQANEALATALENVHDSRLEERLTRLARTARASDEARAAADEAPAR